MPPPELLTPTAAMWHAGFSNVNASSPTRSRGIALTPTADAAPPSATSMKAMDSFLTQVYYAETTGEILVILRNRKPTRESWVMLERLAAGEITIERYHGQSYVGVVRWLRFYRLTQSEQERPARACPN